MKKQNLDYAINEMVTNIKNILKDNLMSIYVYGSYVLNDFKNGWSDIDLLVLTRNQIEKIESEKLLNLRQTLKDKFPNNPYFKCFEGAMLPYSSFLNQTNTTVVYWGTKASKIKDTYSLDSFSMKELLENGKLIFGEETRNNLAMPSFQNLKDDIIHHYKTIRDVAVKTGRNFYSFGWLLDISRCLYTLKTGNIISKTNAGEWAIKNNLCPKQSIKALKVAIKVRKSPLKYKTKQKIFDYAETLGPQVQEYANVLQKELGV